MRHVKSNAFYDRPFSEKTNEGYNYEKTISLFPALLMCAALLPFTLGAAHADAEGQLSDSVYWSFDAANGKLTIGGTGEIPGFIYGQVRPWGDYADAIREIEILDGVTAIGTYAFQSHGSLKKVTIPNSVTRIDHSAFHYCRALPSITIPDSVTEIGEWAFYQCASLNDITLSKNLDRLHRYVFNDTGWWNSHADGLLYLGNVLVGFRNTTPEIVRSKTARG
jgi:hypothetical protein